MEVVDKTVVQNRFLKLEGVVNILTELREVSEGEFLKDPRTNGATMFNLVVGIELIVDIGNYILSQAFQKPEKTYKDVILALGKRGVVPDEFAQQNQDMPRFRNKLIHVYPEIDLVEVYQHLQKAPDVFRTFAKHFSDFLDRQAGVE